MRYAEYLRPSRIPMRLPVAARERGLVLYLPMVSPHGNILQDFSGYGNHGTIHGAKWVEGKFGKALSFDGVDDYVEVADSASLRITDKLTILGWVYMKAYPYADYARLVDKGRMYELAIKADTGMLSFALNNDVGWTWRESDDVVPLNKWTQIGLTYDSDTGIVRLFMNGKEVHTFSESGTITPDNYILTLGCFYDRTRIVFHGLIDEVRIYNRALSEEEIRDLYLGLQYLVRG